MKRLLTITLLSLSLSACQLPVFSCQWDDAAAGLATSLYKGEYAVNFSMDAPECEVQDE